MKKSELIIKNGRMMIYEKGKFKLSCLFGHNWIINNQSTKLCQECGLFIRDFGNVEDVNIVSNKTFSNMEVNDIDDLEYNKWLQEA